MSQKVEIITDEAGNKKSVVMPYAMYEALITALAAHDETMDKLMKTASALVESQVVRVESKAPRVESQAARVESRAPRIESPAPPQTPPPIQTQERPDALSPLSEAPKDPRQDIRCYQRAKGYFTETGGFWVLEGSIARFHVSNAFEAVEALVTLRRKLIDEGVLATDPNFPEYVFMRDCYFHSASAAACIVDGNARNNPSVWRKSKHPAADLR